MAGYKIGRRIAPKKNPIMLAPNSTCVSPSRPSTSFLPRYPRSCTAKATHSRTSHGPRTGEPYEPEMQPKRMGPKKHTSNPDGDSKLSPSGSEQFRDQTRGRTSARANLGGGRVDVSDICGSASCSDLGYIACVAAISCVSPCARSPLPPSGSTAVAVGAVK